MQCEVWVNWHSSYGRVVTGVCAAREMTASCESTSCRDSGNCDDYDNKDKCLSGQMQRPHSSLLIFKFGHQMYAVNAAWQTYFPALTLSASNDAQGVIHFFS